MLKAVQRPIANVVWKSLFLLAAGAGWQETRDSLLLRLGMNNWEGWSHFLGRQQIFYFSGKSFHVSNTKRIWQGRQPSSSPNALRLCQVRCDSFVPRLKPLRLHLGHVGVGVCRHVSKLGPKKEQPLLAARPEEKCGSRLIIGIR